MGVPLFFANATDMPDIMLLGYSLSARWIVITFVQTQILRRLPGRFWAGDHNGIQG
jgi:hypothetical protein